jgi:hypothetical protein
MVQILFKKTAKTHATQISDLSNSEKHASNIYIVDGKTHVIAQRVLKKNVSD